MYHTKINVVNHIGEFVTNSDPTVYIWPHTFLQSYNGITMFGDGHMTTTGERGICVTTSPEIWRDEKRGQLLSGSWPKALSARTAAPGASLLPWLVVAKAWGGDTLKNTRLVMEVAWLA